VTGAFKNYKHGIMSEEFLDCSDENKQINHAVTIVGYGKSDKKTVQNSWCKSYWIVRNSWGSSWGEQGFFKLCMDKAGESKTPYGTCHINRFPAYPQ
jgi:C1A family cysteine protease